MPTAVPTVSQTSITPSPARRITSVYMYLLEGEREAALIDTGVGMIDLKKIVQSLTALPLLVLNTHGHFDHTGGNTSFDRVYLHEADKEAYRVHYKMQEQFPQYTFRTPKGDILSMRDGDSFDLGGRTLEVIHTPGHTIGSVCVLDRERRWLFTGDTCCKADVLLNLDYCTTVEEYLGTIRKLQVLQQQYDVTWPAHYAVPVEPSVLDQFLEAGQMLCEGKARGERIDTALGPCERLPFQDIGIVYLPERVKANRVLIGGIADVIRKI